MDVTCERCGTEYEFDETLVSDRGTTVKCTNCGHLFKVYPPGAEPGSSDRAWIVRKKSGGTEKLGSLRELQQRITEGKVDEDDELSRSGAAWKRLGDIAELQTFFLAAKAAATVPDSGQGPPKKQTLFGVGAAPSVPAPPSPPHTSPPSAPPPRPQPTPPRPQSVRPAPPPPRPSSRPTPPPARPVRQEMPRAPMMSEAPPDTAAGRARAPTLDDPAATAPAKQQRAPKTSEPPASARPRKKALYLDEEEAPALPTKRSGGAGLWVLLLVLVGGGVAAALNWDSIAPMIGLGEAAEEDPIASFLAAGEAALALDTEAGYRDAIREFTRASALAERDERVLVALSRTHAAMAQALTFHASDLRARSAQDPAAAGGAERVERDAASHAEQAKNYGEETLRYHPASAEGELVLADALRLTGELSDARHHMDRSGSMRDEPTAMLHLGRGLLIVAEREAEQPSAPADPPEGEAPSPAGPPSILAGREGFEAAVRLDGSLLRARLALARMHLAANDVETARSELAAVRAVVSNHAAAQALSEAIDQGLAPAPAVVELGADAGVGETTETTETTAPSETAMTTVMGGGGGGGGDDRVTPGRRDYSWFIREGGRLLQAGNTSEANQMYQSALELRPGSSEANSGLGYVALAQGRASQAASLFRAAALNDYGDAYIGLADAYRRMGRTEDAVTTYRRYLSSRPSGPHAGLARRQIEALAPEVATMDTTMDEAMEATPMEETPMTETMEQAPTEQVPMEAAPTEMAPPVEDDF